MNIPESGPGADPLLLSFTSMPKNMQKEMHGCHKSLFKIILKCLKKYFTEFKNAFKTCCTKTYFEDVNTKNINKIQDKSKDCCPPCPTQFYG